MKKFLSKAILVVCLLCLLSLSVSAFSPVGSVFVEKAEITLDGKIDENEYPYAGHRLINEGNATAQGWVGDYPDNTYLNLYFAWDDDNLYIAGDVIDPTFRYCPEGTYLDGDSCQLSLNVDKIFKTVGPESRAIFYSWALQENGTIDVIRQESFGNGVLNDVGKGAKTDNGWCFEIALSLDVLLEDAGRKANAELDIHNGTEIGALFCYLDVDENGGLGAAFGTSSTEIMAWDPAAHGMTLSMVGDRIVASEETTSVESSLPEETTVTVEESSTSEIAVDSEPLTDPKEGEPSENDEPLISIGVAIGIVAVLVIAGVVGVIVRKKK